MGVERNINFDEFLKYYQYEIKHKLSLSSNIDLTIQNTNQNKLLRIIDSTF